MLIYSILQKIMEGNHIGKKNKHLKALYQEKQNPYKIQKISLNPIDNCQHISRSNLSLTKKKTISHSSALKNPFFKKNKLSIQKIMGNGQKKKEQSQDQTLIQIVSQELRKLQERNLVSVMQDRIVFFRKSFIQVWSSLFNERKTLSEKVNSYEQSYKKIEIQKQKVNIKMKEILHQNKQILKRQFNASYQMIEILDILQDLLSLYKSKLEKEEIYQKDIKGLNQIIFSYQDVIQQQDQKLLKMIHHISNQNKRQVDNGQTFQVLECKLKQILSEKDSDLLDSINLNIYSQNLSDEMKKIAQSLKLDPPLGYIFQNLNYFVNKILKDINKISGIIANKQNKLKDTVKGIFQAARNKSIFVYKQNCNDTEELSLFHEQKKTKIQNSDTDIIDQSYTQILNIDITQ